MFFMVYRWAARYVAFRCMATSWANDTALKKIEIIFSVNYMTPPMKNERH